MEQADSASFAIPFLSVVQKMSPICDEASGVYNEDAKPGMLHNTVTGRLYDGKIGLHILCAHYQRRFLRWAPKAEGGGGFKGEFLPEVAAQMESDGKVINDGGRLYFPLEDGTVNEKKCDRLADVRNHFIVLEDTGEHMLLSLGSTQIKKSKGLLSMMSAIKLDTPNGKVTPPTWANRVMIQTVLEQNDQGSWYGVKFTLDGFTKSKDAYQAAKEFYLTLREGKGPEVKYTDETASQQSSDQF
jgi:hypothetical protein